MAGYITQTDASTKGIGKTTHCCRFDDLAKAAKLAIGWSRWNIGGIGGIAGGKMKPAYLLFVLAFASAAFGADPQALGSAPPDWTRLYAKDAFSLLAPPGTRFVPLQGINSFVAAFKNPTFNLEFDYGMYSNSLDEFIGDRRFTVESTTIDGLNGRLVTGPRPDDARTGCRHQTLIYVVNSYVGLGMSALEMEGCTDDESQIPVIQRIFKSIKFVRPHAEKADAAFTQTDDDLFAAASNGDLVKVQALIAGGANVNATTAEGATALIIASKNGHAAIVRSLLDAKADVNAKTCFSGFMAMVLDGDTRSPTEAKSDAGAKPCIGETALMAAVHEGHGDVVQALIAAKADVNIKTAGDRGYTALIWAIESGRADLVRTLIAAKADIHATLNGGVTSLMEAAHGNFGEIVQLLIAAGADVNARTDYGDTALIMASQHEFTKVVQALIAAHADVNCQTASGETALIMASQMGNVGVVQLLIAAGADVNAKTKAGDTALKLASGKRRAELVQILRNAGAKE